MKGKEERKELLKWLIKRVLLVIPVACILLWIYAVCQTSSIKDQTKIGVTYMTMNNEFYKSIHSEISRIADERGALVSVRDPELDEKRQSQQIDDFCAQKVNVIVINPVKGGNVDTLVALNDRSAIGALAAIKEQGITHPIAIYGIDGSPDMKALLHSTDDVVGTVAQSPLKMGDRVMEVIQDMADGKSYQKEITIPVQMMTKENIDHFDVNGWQ